jgi:uncharacterized membrane protein
MLYIYFCYFFQKKKEALTQQYGVFTCKQKALVIWCLLMIVLNILLVFISNAVEIVTIFKIDLKNKFVIGKVVIYFWY